MANVVTEAQGAAFDATDSFNDASGPFGYRAEGQRQNLCLQSDAINVTWTARGTTTITPNAVAGPDGRTTADLVEDLDTQGVNDLFQNVIAVADDVRFEPSFWIKKVTASGTLGLSHVAGASDGVWSLDLSAVGSGWERITRDHSGITVTTEFKGEVGGNNSGVQFFSGTTLDFYLAGVQIEVGTFSSSNIPTTTTAVTRNADFESGVAAGNVGVVAGTIFMEWTPDAAAQGTIFLWGSFVDASNYTAILHDGTNMIFRKRIGGSNNDATKALAYVAGTTYKIAGTYDGSGIQVYVDGVAGTADSNATDPQFGTDFDFASTYSIDMAEGRYFDNAFSTDSQAVVINESAARMYGVDDIVGRNLIAYAGSDDTPSLKIIGIMKDFHLESLHQKIRPMVIFPMGLQGNNFGRYVTINLKGADRATILGTVESIWKDFAVDQAFEYTYMVDNLNKLYQNDLRTSAIMSAFTILAIFIGCLGLLGLAAFAAEQRTKEIGIRKVLGAAISDIYMILSKEILVLVGIAILVSYPASYYLMDRWLQDFAFRVGFSPAPFIFSGLLAVAIAVSTISYQVLKAAMANPIYALKYE